MRSADIAAAGSNIQVDKMRFLLRITFWLGLVLVLLPRDKTAESEKIGRAHV